MRELQLDFDNGPRPTDDTGARIGRRAALERALRDAIRVGRLTPGSPLPASRSLAADIGCSRSTVVAAYEQLVTEGYLTAHHGSATRVAATLTPPHETIDDNPLGPSPQFDLRPGEPDASAFPRQQWMRSIRSVMHSAPDEALGYPDPRGRLELRNAMATYLRRARTVEATAAAVFVYGGFASAVGFLGETLRRRGIDRVAVEDPALPLHIQVLRLAGITTVPIAVDPEGMSIDALDASGAQAAVVTPANQYPLGVTMSPTRRAALVEWANAGGTGGSRRWIIEDDYDGEFRYDGRPVGSIQGLAPDSVIYAGTASKSLAAGLRLGWLVVPAELRRDLLRTTHIRSGVSVIEQLALADFVERGALDRQIRSMRVRYRRRRDLLVDTLTQSAQWLEVPHATAGLHLTMPLSTDAPSQSTLVRLAAERSLGITTLAQHTRADQTTPGLVVGFSRPSDVDFVRAVEVLDEVIAAAGH